MEITCFHSSRKYLPVSLRGIRYGGILFLTLFLFLFTPKDLSAQAPVGKLCNSYGVVIDKVKWNNWCGDGDCLIDGPAWFKCCDAASPGCVINGTGIWVNGGMDLRYKFKVRRQTPTTGGYSPEQIYVKNNIGSWGCGNKGYTATFDNFDFGQFFFNECVNTVQIAYDVWEEDACGSQLSFNDNCGFFDNLFNDDECRALGTYTTEIDPFDTYQDGNRQDITQNLPISQGGGGYCNDYGWIYDLYWDVTRPPVMNTNSITICSGGTASFQVTAAPEQGGDFVVLTDPLNWNTKVGPTLDGASIPATFTTPSLTSNQTYYVVETNNNPTLGNWCRGDKTQINVIINPEASDPGYGANVWNVVGYNGVNLDLDGSPAETRRGFYTESSLDYETSNRWGLTASPSAASGWTGCSVNNDNHTVVSKRQGFPAGDYNVYSTNRDDNSRIYINSTTVYTDYAAGTADLLVYSGSLNSSSTIEVRHTSGSGNSRHGLRFVPCSQGDPDLFGANKWNVYAYGGMNLSDLSSLTYKGWYTENLLNYQSTWRWEDLSETWRCGAVEGVSGPTQLSESPSDAGPGASTNWTGTGANGSGYLGCPVGSDNTTVVSKRRGFTCGKYEINVAHADAYSLYIDQDGDGSAVLVDSGTGKEGDGFTNGAAGYESGTVPNTLWDGFLGPNSTVELRHVSPANGNYCNANFQGLRFVDNAAAPSRNTAVTLSSSCWANSNNEVYTITVSSDDKGSGWGNPYGIEIAINESQGANGEGIFSWNPIGFAYTANNILATGGGFGSKDPNNGGSKIELLDVSTTLVGSQRTVTFTVSPNSGFESNSINNLSMRTSDFCGNSGGWDPIGSTWASFNSPSAPVQVSTDEFCAGGNAVFSLASNPPVGTHDGWDSLKLDGTWTTWNDLPTATWMPNNCNATRTARARFTVGGCPDVSDALTTTVFCPPSPGSGYSQIETFGTPAIVEICDGPNGYLPTTTLPYDYLFVIEDVGNPISGSLSWEISTGASGPWVPWLDPVTSDPFVGLNSGYGAFPVNPPTNKWVRVRSFNGTVCPDVLGEVVEIQNHNAPAPTSLTSDLTAGCLGATGDMTLSATYPYGTNTFAEVISDYAQVEFWKDGCGTGNGGTLLATLNHTLGSVDLGGVAIPGGTGATTYYTRSVSVCETSPCTSVTYTVDDVPPTAICQNVTVSLDAAGNGSTTPGAVNNGSSDNCALHPSTPFALDISSFNCSTLGDNSVTLTVTDNNGNQSTCFAIVEVVDLVLPVANCQDVTVTLDAAGNGSTTAGAVDNSSSDACGIQSIALSQVAFNCAHVGGNAVTLTVTDNNSNVNTCGATVTVVDNTNPVAVCQNITIQLDGAGNGTADPNAVNGGSTDACGVASYSLNNSAFTCANVGGNAVILTATDNNGNTNTCNATVTVEDNVDPVANCQDITIQLDAAGNGIATAAAVDNNSTDACGIASVALNNTSFNCTNVGANGVILTATDNNGNTNTCNATVTVEDNVAPTANCQDLTISLDAGGNANTTPAAVNNGSSDACGIANLSLDDDSWNCYEEGNHVVTLTVTDNNGNSSTCNATITVQDNSNPIAVCQDLTVQLDASGNGDIMAYTANSSNDYQDNMDCVWEYGQYPAFNSGAWALLPIWTGFVWADVQPFGTPWLDANGGHPGVTDSKWAVRRWNSPFNGSVTISGSFFDRDGGCGDGVHIRIRHNTTEVYQYLNLTTAQGTVNYSFTLTVAAGDIVDFVIDPIGDTGCDDTEFTANVTPTTAGLVVDNGSSDACGIRCITVSPSSFDCSDISGNPNVVTLTVTDYNNNVATCNANITVEDNVDPVAVCQDVTVQLNAAGTGSTTAAAVDNGSSDACGGVFSLALDITAFDCTDVGANPVVLTVTDFNSNVSTCNATVTVEDNVDPTVFCQNVTVQLDAGGNASVTAGAVDNGSSDACGLASVALDVSTWDCSNTGANAVVLTVTDNNGNDLTCNATVTVEDNIAPTITCPADIIVTNDPGICGAVITYSVTTSDNCPAESLVQDAGLASGSTFPGGATVNSFTVTDASNITAVCSFTVTVNETEDPTITCPADVIVSNDAGLCGAVVTYSVTSTDNCPGQTVAQDAGLASGVLFPIGPTVNSFTVTDASSNTASCSFTVTVNDTEIPTITCPADVNVSNDAGVCGATIIYSVTSADNCPAEAITQDAGQASGTVFPIGATVNDFTVTDASSNTATCSFTVTVSEVESPSVSCPPDQVIDNDAGVCGAVVNYTITSTDNCPGETVAQDAGLASGSTFPIGVTVNDFTATDAFSNTGTCSFSITVNDTEDPTISCPSDITVNADPGNCNAVVNYTTPVGADNCPAPVTLQTAGLGSGAAFPPGTTTETYEVTDAYANTASCSFTVEVTLVSAPSVTLDVGDIEVCEDYALTLTATGVGGTAPYLYLWESSADGLTNWGTVQYTASNTYDPLTSIPSTIYYRVTYEPTGSGCADPVSDVISVTVVEDPTAAIDNGNVNVCQDPVATYTLTSTVSGGTGTVEYQWQQSGNGIIWNDVPSNGNNATYDAPLSGGIGTTIFYKLLYTRAGGNTGCDVAESGAQTVTITADPTVAISGGGVTICSGASATLTANISGGTGTFDYQWYTGPSATGPWTPDGAPSASDTYAASPVTEGSVNWYQVEIIPVGNAGCNNHTSSAVSVSVHYNSSPAASITSYDNVCAGSPATLTAVGGTLGTGAQYEWDVDPLFASSTLTAVPTLDVTVNATTTYYVRLTGTCNTTAAVSKTITVLQPSSMVELIANGSAADGANLVETCEDVNGFTYYTLAGVYDSYAFAINWDPLGIGGGHNANAKASALPYITVDDLFAAETDGGTPPCIATWTMERYWNVVANALDGGVMVRFYFDVDEYNRVVDHKNSFVTATCLDEGQEWFKVSGTYDPSVDLTFVNPIDPEWIFDYNTLSSPPPNTAGDMDNGVLYAEFILESFSGGTLAAGIGGNSSPLPVELVSLTATALNNSIMVDWATASEINNDKFEILKSVDGLSFVKIAEVPGNGTTADPHSYSYEDEDVEFGITYYYRLRQVDLDGTSELSTIVSAELDRNDIDFSIGDFIPNPTFTETTIDIVVPADETIEITIMNVLGEEVFRGYQQLTTGSNNIEFDVARYAQGNYIATFVSSSQGIFSKKFTVLK